MADTGPEYDGITPEHQAMVDDIRRLLAWGVTVTGSVNPAFCDTVHDRCRAALAADPALLAFVGSAYRVADRQTSDEFVAHGSTTTARLWAGLGDRLQELIGGDAPPDRAPAGSSGGPA
jgi:hypothetical protein